MGDFQTNIQNWVSLDNKIKQHQAEVKQLRETRNNLSDNIFGYAEQNNLENAVIEISDGKLKFQNTKVTSPLTFKLVENCLLECIPNEEKVKSLMKYIKSKRDIKFVNDIKRSYIK
jgi:hypothetical protein